MKDYIDTAWQDVLAANGLLAFEAWWDLDAPWFEEPNQRRGGWSGVSRHELTLADGGRTAVFLKRQENHSTFSWRHPRKGIPTFAREFRLIQRYHAADVPTLEPVYFAMRDTAAGQRAILVTEELTGYQPLDACPLAGRQNRLAVLTTVAALLRRMHDSHIQHNCFYPKHVFVRVHHDDHARARVIDLEKSRRRSLVIFCSLRDLDTLNRHTQGWSRVERLRFLKAYLGQTRLSRYGKWLWHKLARRAAHKARP